MKQLPLVLAALLGAVFPLRAAEPVARPNIIFILSDDVGLGNLSCYGGDKFKTPQLDALAQSGTRFEHCYATPLCGPTRCLFLTGRYPFRTGLINNHSHNAISPAREVMIPTVLKQAGYATAQAGKWGQMCLGPGEWGFDEYLVFPGSGRYWRAQTSFYTQNGKRKELPAGVYLPELMHGFVVDFIQRHQAQPFFVYYAMSQMHGPIVRTPESRAGGNLYAENNATMDKLVGRLVAELDRLGLREKTLIVFSGDNGTAGSANKATVDGRPLSGHKATMLEGGSRVPLIASWPGTLPAGKLSRDLIDFSDFFATFAELAGAKLPEGVKVDGRSFAAQLRGQTGQPREWAYVELDGKFYVRTADWKLNQAGELFDMSGAPFVEKLVTANAQTAAALAAREHLHAVLSELNPSPRQAGDAVKAKPPKTKQQRQEKKTKKRGG